MNTNVYVYLWVRRPDCDWHDPDVEASVKSGDQVNTGRVDQSDVITRV
jgi:hypothetical protein